MEAIWRGSGTDSYGSMKMARGKNMKTAGENAQLRHVRGTVAVLIVLTAACGCHPSCKWVSDIGSELDEMAKGREKFGTISFSAESGSFSTVALVPQEKGSRIESRQDLGFRDQRSR